MLWSLICNSNCRCNANTSSDTASMHCAYLSAFGWHTRWHMCTSGHTKWDRQSSQQERKRGKGKTEASARPLGWSVTGTSVNCLIFNLSFSERTTAPPKVAAAQSKSITAAAVYHSDPSHSVPMLMSPNVITLSQPHTHKQLMIRTLVLFLSICRFVCLFEQSSSCAASWRYRHHFKVWNFQVPLSLSFFQVLRCKQSLSFDLTEMNWAEQPHAGPLLLLMAT